MHLVGASWSPVHMNKRKFRLIYLVHSVNKITGTLWIVYDRFNQGLYYSIFCLMIDKERTPELNKEKPMLTCKRNIKPQQFQHRASLEISAQLGLTRRRASLRSCSPSTASTLRSAIQRNVSKAKWALTLSGTVFSLKQRLITLQNKKLTVIDNL